MADIGDVARALGDHAIPEALVAQIRAGRAAIVVGSELGVAGWDALLARLTAVLASRGRDGDVAAAADVERLLAQGNQVRAVGFLARALGDDVGQRVVGELWGGAEAGTGAVASPLATAVAQVPVRHVWTTFPGDQLARALEHESPAGWPPPRVATYLQLGELSLRRRTLVHVLGDLDSYVVAPGSVRRALSGAVDLRAYARTLYVEGALVFVGFRDGDPDLAALLDRVVGVFEPPRGTHYLLSAALGPVATDELRADHHIEVIPLAAAGDAAGWLAALAARCAEAGCSLAQARPDADDLDGWLAVLAEAGDDPEAPEVREARDALDGIEQRGRAEARWAEVAELLLGRIEHATGDGERARLLRELAEVYATLGDWQRAFEASVTACELTPEDDAAAALAERLATVVGAWAELVDEAQQIATAATDPALAARWWTRLAGWYVTRLDHADYALPSLRRALELDPGHAPAHAALAAVQRQRHEWAALADTLRGHAALATAERAAVLVELGELLEHQLAQPAAALDAYAEAAAATDGAAGSVATALAALDRLYRRGERWAELVGVLERRAAVTEDPEAARGLRRELATIRADKLGDLEGAIARHAAVVAAAPGDAAAWRALVELYGKTGRTDDRHAAMARHAEVAPAAERVAILRALAGELRDPARAAAVYAELIAADGSDLDHRGLARVLEAQQAWAALVDALGAHAAATADPATRVERLGAAAAVLADRLAQPATAAGLLRDALAIEPANLDARAALARCYLASGEPARAVEVLAELARHAPEAAAAHHAEAARIAHTQVGDLDLAQRHYDRALALDPEHAATLVGLAALHEQRAQIPAAVELLLRAEPVTRERAARAQLLWRASELVARHLADPSRALDLARRVLVLEPDHAEAGDHAAEALAADGQWDEALPILAMLARRADGLDAAARAHREAQLGRAYAALHRSEPALRHYRRALELDPAQLAAARGLAVALMSEAAATTEPAAAQERWQEVDRHDRELLARHRGALATAEVADAWHRLGTAARALGDDTRAEAHLRRALEQAPHHAPALAALIELGGARGDWRLVADAMRSQLAALDTDDDGRAKLCEALGDLCRERLRDGAAAVVAYQRGLEHAPHARTMRHKLLEAYTEQRRWREALDVLAALAASEQVAEHRARFHYAAAVIARDELRDTDLAAARFTAALDDAPHTPRAFSDLEELLADAAQWKQLARAYRRQLKRIGDDADLDELLALWTRLGDTYLDRLDDREAATEAYQVASELAPDDRDRREQLADLYLAAGEPRRADAIAALHDLLAGAPDRAELYAALAAQYRAAGEVDKAWCVAQALVFLGAASPADHELYAAHRTAAFVPAARRLTEELWQRSLIHPREDRHVGAIFASTLGALAGDSAQPVTAFGLAPEARADLDRDPHPVSRIVKYVGGVLGIDPAPMVWLQESGDGLRVANTVGLGAERARLVPSLLIGAPQLGKHDERELAFEVGKRMAYLRPERFVTLALGTLPRLEAGFAAAVLAGGAAVAGADGEPFAAHAGDEAHRLAAQLRDQVPAAMLAQVGELAEQLSGRVGNGLIAGWRTATDLTANRVGFVVANDLATAARAIATEGAALSSLPVVDRLRELLAYAVSESYFTVRRHLGLQITDRGAAILSRKA